MKLSIVIPVYNTEPYLDACLASCLKQDVDLSDYELVIVNDGTKDNAMAIAERFAKEYPNITIISQENAGLSAARNAGLVVSKGDYVWFVDSDDCIDKKALSLIFNKIEDKPDVICLQAKRSDTYVLRNVFSG
ncbi:MAG: glycosyltransferase, partial [Bacteroidales bacterium]|nr:glycosyltransferase [Bacteroidales bacterium]